jgi:hypothetical protein
MRLSGTAHALLSRAEWQSRHYVKGIRMNIEVITITEIGCYLDNHRGHYIVRDMIQLAEGYGYIVGPFEQWALETYESHSHEDGYPQESLIELADDALAWLNHGRDLPRMAGQNFPPIIPAGTAWDWFDGDFGLYAIEELED